MRLYSQPVIGTIMRLAYSPTWGLAFFAATAPFYVFFHSAAAVPKQVAIWGVYVGFFIVLFSSYAGRGAGYRFTRSVEPSTRHILRLKRPRLAILEASRFASA
jgi:hypothetical protein